MTWVQLCTTERRPSLLMDGQQSSIIKATRYVFQQTWQQPLTTNIKQQPTNNNWQPTTGQGMAGITWWAKGAIWPPGVGQIFLFQKKSSNWWQSMFMYQQFPAISKNCESSTSVQRHPYKGVMLGQFVQRRPRLSFCFCCSSFTIGLLASSEMCKKK